MFLVMFHFRQVFRFLVHFQPFLLFQKTLRAKPILDSKRVSSIPLHLHLKYFWSREGFCELTC